MNTKARISNAERFGRRIGGIWWGFVRRERQVAGWLVARGLSAGAATALLWGVKLAVLGVLLYAIFWLALLLVFAIMAGRAAEQILPADDFELQFPTLEELRQAPGYDPNLHNDISHEMYHDDD
ncbi:MULTISPECIES: DUF3742 family protein [Pseudomonas]|uniref:DUF3742 family protein n=1 Tax=Pseudomonas TaxID=286 RepID=UPI00093DAA7D|nr:MULTISPECIES: DUF3742 family protein [Pseudomonas]MDH0639291.1 DUF3742 family protein [Pseudomonas sp. GD03860]